MTANGRCRTIWFRDNKTFTAATGGYHAHACVSIAASEFCSVLALNRGKQETWYNAGEMFES